MSDEKPKTSLPEAPPQFRFGKISLKVARIESENTKVKPSKPPPPRPGKQSQSQSKPKLLQKSPATTIDVATPVEYSPRPTPLTQRVISNRSESKLELLQNTLQTTSESAPTTTTDKIVVRQELSPRSQRIVLSPCKNKQHITSTSPVQSLAMSPPSSSSLSSFADINRQLSALLSQTDFDASQRDDLDNLTQRILDNSDVKRELIRMDKIL